MYHKEFVFTTEQWELKVSAVHLVGKSLSEQFYLVKNRAKERGHKWKFKMNRQLKHQLENAQTLLRTIQQVPTHELPLEQYLEDYIEQAYARQGKEVSTSSGEYYRIDSSEQSGGITVIFRQLADEHGECDRIVNKKDWPSSEYQAAVAQGVEWQIEAQQRSDAHWECQQYYKRMGYLAEAVAHRNRLFAAEHRDQGFPFYMREKLTIRVNRSPIGPEITLRRSIHIPAKQKKNRKFYELECAKLPLDPKREQAIALLAAQMEERAVRNNQRTLDKIHTRQVRKSLEQEERQTARHEARFGARLVQEAVEKVQHLDA